ncbi:putative hydrolase or acyltransferase of alpha/beta superfamily [Pseudomonas sp. GM50]|uniref:alpha/beta fold hydrolase n=1 Tax=Pseudomonas sp. GM50 TaxID=1144332 RepID=UPI0002709931|nr:alpha/beta hydrolase [Pseudomonas sp. GM50]EJM62326.1 putative hydrolase or acyltransferase of alpha/beta superfamily [Pseudomonas sp. GM50]
MSSFVCAETLWIDTPHGRLFTRRWFPADVEYSQVKPPIILFHDSLGCVELWRDFPERLCQTTKREVIAYDRLGFGQSDPYPESLPMHFIRDEAERFFALIRAEFQFDRFVALGHSVGGAMAANCASLYPQSCAALITVSAQAFVEEQTLRGIRDAKAQFEAPGQLARLEKYHGDKAHWVLSAWTDTWLSQAFSGWTIEDAIDSIHCPLLALHGEQDEYGSVLHPMRIAKLTTAHGEYLILENCHHVPHRDAPNVVLDAVSRLLRISH